VNEDGGFQVDDVPPGTYELNVRVTGPANGRSHSFRSDVLGELKMEVVVPDGLEPWDLGQMKVVFRDHANLPRVQAMVLNLPLVGGSQFRLAEHRGRPVVVVVVADWSERCAQEVEALNDFRRTLEEGKGQHPFWLGVRMGSSNPSAVVSELFQGGLGAMATLEGPRMAEVAGLLQVETVPAIVMFDAEGKLWRRHLDPAQLQEFLVPLTTNTPD